MIQILLMPWTHRSGSVHGHELRTAWRRSAVEQTPGSTAVMKRSLCRRASGVHQDCMQVPSTVRQADGLGCARRGDTASVQTAQEASSWQMAVVSSPCLLSTSAG